MKKVIYNTYSCAISGMSREMMKMDGRDSAEYQFWQKRDIMVILEFDFKSLNDKLVNSYLPQMLKESQNVRGKKFWSSSRFA